MASRTIGLDHPAVPLPWIEKWSPFVQVKILAYFAACFIALSMVPNSIWDPAAREFVYVIGLLGIWRYLWWFNHWMRALVFANVAYPRMRDRAAEVWASGWRPRHIHIQMTTFREHREISEAVIRALCSEIREAGVPATIWLGSSELSDEEKIGRHLKLVGDDCDITLRIIRQNIVFSLGVKAIFLVLTFAGMASLWGAIAADVGASLLVVFNALRLLRLDQTGQDRVAPVTRGKTATVAG